MGYWISIEEKQSGVLRIGIDPNDLNKAVMRDHFLIPTLNEIFDSLAGKSVFLAIDTKERLWQYQLDKESPISLHLIRPVEGLMNRFNEFSGCT